MHPDFATYLQNLQGQQQSMIQLLTDWVNINSGTDNIEGLQKMFAALEASFIKLGSELKSIPLSPRQKIDALGNQIEIPVGNALEIIQRPELKRRVFLGGHMDTVYSSLSSFQNAEMLSQNVMRGPGAADMKGGLLIMLKALEIFESSPWAKNIGWNLIINPDEEIGSVSSETLILESARNCQMGMIFEPSFSDGNLVSSRKGSMNYSVVARGKAAHAGRDFHQGRNAIMALANFAVGADALNNPSTGTTVNIGYIQGGGAVNIVPDLAICKLNVRCDLAEEQMIVDKLLKDLIAECNKIEGIDIQLFQEGFRAPKPFDAGTKKLFETLQSCSHYLDLDLAWRPSGGVCDGNILALAGVPCIDTLGAVGGNIHTHDEYVELESLPKRAALAALMLMHFAAEQYYI